MLYVCTISIFVYELLPAVGQSISGTMMETLPAFDDKVRNLVEEEQHNYKNKKNLGFDT